MIAGRRLLRPSVGFRFALVLGLASAIIFAAALALILHRLKAQDASQAERNAVASTDRLATAVQRVFADTFSVTDKVNDDLLALKEAGVQDPVVYDTLLQRMIDGGDRFGAWLAWDGKAAPGGAAMAARLDASGRYAPYIHQNGMEVLRDRIPDEILGSSLYRVPHDEGRAYLLAPHEIDAAAGDPTLVTSFSRPLQQDGHIVGVLAVDVKLDTITQAVSALPVPQGSELAVVAENGVIGAATRPGLIGQPIPADSPFQAMFARAKAGDGAELVPGRDLPILASWKAVRFAEVKNPWFVLIRTPQVSALTSGWEDRLEILAIAASAILAVLFLMLVTVQRLVSAPLHQIGKIIDDLGAGLFGMDVPNQDRADEIGDVARAIVRLQDGAMEIARLREENGEREYQRVVERENEIEAISSRFSASIETVAGALRGVSATVGGRSKELTCSVDAAVERLQELSRASTATRDSMLDAANATTRLRTSIDAIGAQARLCDKAASSVAHNVMATNVSLADLGRSVGDIGSLVEMIGSIADQINLIALNATIEAARAGESGRGFAVVAQEVKTLAGRTSAAADAVTAHIKALEKSSTGTHDSVFAIETAFDSMRAIAGTIVLELEAQMSATGAISSLVDQALQSADVTAITVEELSGVANGVTIGTGELHEQSYALDHEVHALDAQVSRFVEFLKAS